jgi:hypothetical protein
MAHFLELFLIDLLVQAQIAPVLTHRGVEKILVDGDHFALEDLVELCNDFGCAFYGSSPLKSPAWGVHLLACPVAPFCTHGIGRLSFTIRLASRRAKFMEEGGNALRERNRPRTCQGFSRALYRWRRLPTRIIMVNSYLFHPKITLL